MVSRRIWILLIATSGLILGAFLVTALTNKVSLDTPTPYELVPGKAIDIELPSGDYAWQDGADILFMSTVWLDGSLPTDVIKYSAGGQQESWRTGLAAPPLQAMDIGDAYLIATANEAGNGHLYSLAKEDGRVLWDQVFGDSIVGLTHHNSRIWVAGAQGVGQLDPDTGATLSAVVTWDSPPTSSDWRVLLAYEDAGALHLAASAGREIFSYVETNNGWQPNWRFRAANSVLELHSVPWSTGETPHLLVLAHSAAYDIREDGTTSWHFENNDLNQDGQTVRCERGEIRFVFRNVMSGIYLMDRNGLVRSWELPGGAAQLGPIPLPIPANPAFGLTVADLDGDAQDEIIARSVTRLFVFNCQAVLLASASLGTSDGSELVTQMRSSPRYRPFVVGDEMVVAEKGQISYFSLKP